MKSSILAFIAAALSFEFSNCKILLDDQNQEPSDTSWVNFMPPEVVVRDFKAALTYFSEPFLKGAVLNGTKLEGENSEFMATKILNNIKALEEQDQNMADLGDLVTFKNKLVAGIKISNKIERLLTLKGFDEISENSKSLQMELIAAIMQNNGIILPSGWLDHAIALIIKPGAGANTFDLAVVNTGDGINFHHNCEDPNGIYPFLSLPWIEFSGIPAEDIFSPSAWFIQGLIAINTESFRNQLRKSAAELELRLFPSIPEYFYGSFISNFVDYLIDYKDSTKKRLIPMQRSGSCTLSSLMAALLFESKDEKTFYFYRLKLGIILLRDLLMKAEGNLHLKESLTDGFNSHGRKFFRGLASSLAQQTLQYLEFALPENFRHAGLIGSERSKWLAEIKESALAAFKESGIVLSAVQESTIVCKEILQFLDANPIRKTTNIVKIIETDREKLDKFPLKNDLKQSKNNYGEYKTNFYSFLAGTPSRLETPIHDFDSFSIAFSAAHSEKKDSQYFVKIMDVFKRAHHGDKNWWGIFDSAPCENILKLQQLCREMAYSFATSNSNQSEITSFDDISMLAHLQRLSWELARAYDKQLDPENRIGLESLSPPQTLQSVLFGHVDKKLNVLAGNVQNWSIHNIFDIQSYQMLKELLEEVNEKDIFMGPEAFSDPLKENFFPSIPSSSISNEDVYLKMMEHPATEQSYTALTENKRWQSSSPAWIGMPESTAKFLIVFLKYQGKTTSTFPHYYNLMDTLANVRIGAIQRKNNNMRTSDYWLTVKNTSKPESASLTLPVSSFSSKDRLKFMPQSYSELATGYFRIASFPYSEQKAGASLFYNIRHSEALTESIDIISIETWMNYIKNATSAKIFDSFYFQYITDHLLNVPKFNDQGNLMFPVDKITAKSIIEELHKLINISLINLESDDPEMTIERRKTFVIRSVNISVILTRFIERIDYENILSGSACARTLANVYNTIIPFTKFTQKFGISEVEISKLNFALCHACSVRIRNSLTFMQNIEIYRSFKSETKLRKTLERYHWFAARRSYLTPTGSGSCVADDQFIYGITGSPLNAAETDFLQELLFAHFLPSQIDDPAKLDIFKYHSNGTILEMRSSQEKDVSIMVNIWTSSVVKNGFCLVQNNKFMNSDEFRDFFKENERHLASNGTTLEISGTLVYILPDFKGASYLFIQANHRVNIYRKWNNLWFFLDEAFVKYGDSRHSSDSNKNWTSTLKLFSRFETPKIKWTIGFSDNAKDPIYRTIENEESMEFKLAIGDFIEGEGWLLLDHAQRDNTGKIASPREYKPIQKHLDKFAQNDYVAAKDEDGKIIIICPLFRLAEDLDRPLIFKEVESNLETTEFEILNVPGMKVSSDQTLGGLASLPGGLVVVAESKKFLLLPLAEIDPSMGSGTKILEVQKIPIINGSVAPQSRLHKILLAYVLMTSHNYNSALELLNPKSSIVYNEPFTLDELDVFKWIALVKSGAPEINTFKLLAYIHPKLNISKFPTFKYKDGERLKGVTDQLNFTKYYMITNYMFSVRDLSEKYYIYRIFPEILNEAFYSELMNPIKKSMDEIFKKTKSSNFPSIGRISNVPSAAVEIYSYGSFVDETIFFSTLMGSKSAEMNELTAKLTPKRVGIVNFFQNYAMAALCYLNEPELWREFKEKLDSRANLNGSDKIANNHELFGIFAKNMNEVCISKYKKYFDGINQSPEMSLTSLDVIKATMLADLKKIEKYNETQCDSQIEIVTPEDLRQIMDIKIKLQKLTNDEDKVDDNLNYFDQDTIEASKVLESLESSITKFVEENGFSSVSQFEFQGHPELLQNLTDLKIYLENRIDDLTTEQATSLAELTEIKSAEIHSSIISSVLSHAHQKKTKTFTSLYACYMKNSVSCIQTKFPELTLSQCLEVQDKAISFFGRKILIDYFGMLKKCVENFLALSQNSEPVSADDINLFCDELSKVNDFNLRIKNPVIMNFEFRSEKYRLKPEQVKDIELLTSQDEHTKLFPSVVIQRMMAAGKTLVLGTISVVKKALDSSKLSVLVPPASLYQSNTTAMQARTYQYFKKKGDIFYFPRFDIPVTGKIYSPIPQYLETVLDIINRTMNSSNYLILSPDSLSSFINSFIEIILNYRSSENYPQVASKYAQIYRLFKQHGSIILDEIDMTMDPKKELNFPTEENEPYNMTAVTLLTDIVEFLLFDEAIIESGLRIHSNDQASLTSDNYKKCLDFLLDYIERELKDPSSLWHKYIFESSNHEETVETFMKFLRDPKMSSEEDWMREFHGSGNENVANALIIVKFQIHHFLEYSLKGTVNLNYGSAGTLRPDIKFAVPFVAANTPSTSSVFADRWETLLKTLIMISASPCNFNIAEDVIDYLRKAMLSESAGTKSLKLTPTYQNLDLVLPENFNPMNLDKNNRLHVQMLQDALALRSPAAIRILFSYYVNLVFGQMTFPTEQISSNALNLASMFSSVQGYSGTIDNVNILPQTVIKHAFKDHEDNEKFNGGISLKLMKDSEGEWVGELTDSSFKKPVIEMVRDLLALYPSENVSAIIDTGAFFKTFRNCQVAEAILTVYSSRIKAVLYYDEDSNQLEFLRTSLNGYFAHGYLETTDPDDIKRVTQVELSERFTFYDQRHITGSDILQPKTAHAIMTAGPRVLLRDILQGALRMRQFMTSQKVYLVTTAASREFYCSKIKTVKLNLQVSDMLTLGALNEDEKQEQENEKLAYAKIDAEIRAFILDEVSRCIENVTLTEECKNVLKLVPASRSLFLRSIREVPLDLLTEIEYQETQKTLELFAVSRLNMIEDYIPRIEEDQDDFTPIYHRFNNLKRTIQNMISTERRNETDSLLFYMKETVRTPIKLDSGTEVQMQTLNLALSDVNIENLTSYMNSNGSPVEHNYNLLNQLKQKVSYSTLTKGTEDIDISYMSLEQLYNYEKMGENMLPYLRNTLLTSGKRTGVTLDLIKFYEPHSSDTNPFPIFSNLTMEGSHLLLQVFNSNLKVILVSSKHASKLIKDFSESEEENQFWLCDLSGSVTATIDSKTSKGENVLDIIPESRGLIFDLLIFNGSLSQIISNPVLMDIYKNKWLQSDHFRERAIFLKIRMHVLREKDAETFDCDDRNLEILRKMAMGDKNPNVGSMVSGYPKGPVATVFEESVRERFAAVKQNLTAEIETKKTIEFDVNMELGSFFVIIDDQENPPSFGLPETPQMIYENLDFDIAIPETFHYTPREVIHIIEKDDEVNEFSSSCKIADSNEIEHERINQDMKVGDLGT